MNDKLVFGQYYHRNSVIHNLDARTKILALIVLMIQVFIIPQKDYRISFIMLSVVAFFIILAIVLSRVPILKYLKSLKQIAFLLVFSFVLQLLINEDNFDPIVNTNLNFSIVNISIIIVVVVLFFILRKYLKFKFLILLGIFIGSIILLQYPIVGGGFATVALKIYRKGLISGSFIVLRVFLIIMLSTTLTLTTKPTDLSNALEWYLAPLEKIGIKTSIFAMMISIALRFIPTLFNETDKILKAQASRGADLTENSLKEQVKQIIALLIPMFVISFKRAIDLADAMDAKGYIPGAKRTKLIVMKFAFLDYFVIILVNLLLIGLIVAKTLL